MKSLRWLLKSMDPIHTPQIHPTISSHPIPFLQSSISSSSSSSSSYAPLISILGQIDGSCPKMPGTIQVTVVEFKSSKPSAKSLKVSMGRREFRTKDKGEFSFPIAKLSEDVAVTLLDDDGNEVARSDIRTMRIIEKGLWDEVFSVDGCGHVHMKLQFVLSEEDRHRIRIMRESVVKKKLETNPNIANRRLSEIEHVSDSGKGSEGSDSTTNQKEKGTDLDASISDTTDGSRVAPLPPGNEGIETESAQVRERLPDNRIESHPVADVRSTTKEVDASKLSGSDISDLVASKLRDKPMQESQRIKVPSNVRKMISAFESSQIQDTARMDSNLEVKPLKRMPSAQQINRLRKESLPEDLEQKGGISLTDEHMRHSAGIISSSIEPPQVSMATPVILEGKGSEKPNPEELQKLPAGLMAESTLDAATSSGRMVEKQSRVDRAYKEALNSGTKSLERYEEECASAQSSGDEAKTCLERKISSEPEVLEKNAMHGTAHKMEVNRKETARLSESGHSRSPDDSSKGLVGKVIKLAAISGFVLLVLLTRQREPRDSKSSHQKKKSTEDFNNLFSIPNYIDERTQRL